MSVPAAPQPDAGAGRAVPDEDLDDVDDEESPPWPPADARRRRLPPRVTVPLAAIALLALALLVAGLWRAAPIRNLTVPTVAHEPAATGSIEGEVRAARAGAHVCFTLATRSGRVFLVAPRGWTADSSLRLLDPFGRVRLLDGTAVRLVGAPGESDHVAGCPGTGRPWYTVDVRPVGR